MKTHKLIMVFTAILFSTAVTLSQQVMTYQVPEEVLTAFREKFPDASSVKWSKEINLNYEAQFTLATNGERAEFDKNGKWVETENSIKTSDLPKTVSAAVLKKNPSCKIADAEEIQSSEMGKMYEVGCPTKSEKADYRVTPDGTIKETKSSKF